MNISDKAKKILEIVWIGIKIAFVGFLVFISAWIVNHFKKKKEETKKDIKELDDKIKEKEKKHKETIKKREQLEKELAKRRKEAEGKYLKKTTAKK